ncbi:MAG: hypothetical protein A3B30_03435 [Candidatus Komeilibacteria bacterium RIFCSPLOWO2_01_FULL_52_15]|uniref:Polysaccharide pyruvyl transferase domain-containing protein n=1 Tax=Candidatus Komeilibacteria bacterium RIFCSPLOWO2_01_FULL_52_15 TaxID=1798551 RepID=A0A1G2BPH8_9BACT|nr:MAG: hypothetical protein A3B30_03435 [Candidatus Komeilibacteria bacterium RIFCSPLOWO2_01_FULL_52_15]
MTIAHLHVADTKNRGDVAIVLAVQELLRKKFPRCRILDIPLDHLKKGLSRAEIATINRSAFALIGGGGIYYRYFLPFDYKSIHAITTPIVLFGVGYIRELGARPLAQHEIRSAIALNQAATLSSVRDDYTKAWLVRHGVPSRTVQVIGDPAALLSEQKPQHFSRSGTIRVGVNLNYSGWLGFGRYQEHIIKSYNEVTRYFESRGASIFYLQHHPDERRIYPQLAAKKMQVVFRAPREQKYIYGTMDMIIGMMLHSVVLAFGAGTPIVTVGYDLRNTSFVRFIKHPELVIRADQLSSKSLLLLAQTVYRRRAAYRTDFSKRKKMIARAHATFLKKIQELIV